MSQDGHSRVGVLGVELRARTGFGQHSHSRHQLAASAGGVLLVRAAARTWVLPRSRAVWIPAGVPHSTVAGADPALLRSAYVEPAGCPLRWSAPTPVVADALLLALLDRLLEPSLPDPARRRTEAVLFDVVRPASTLAVATPLPEDDRARAVARGWRNDPADPRTLEQWGHAVGASSRTLARLFRAQTGLSAARWRTAARLGAAVELLAGGVPASVVATRVGFATASAFGAAFQREFGVTPAGYADLALEPTAQ